MTPPQYFRVVMELGGRGPCNLLIVGAGRDTELYVRANAGGRTVVLERHAQWIEHVRHLGCEVVQVEYSTLLSQPPLAPCVLPLGLPDEIAGQKWDVILVDGPEGQQPDAPGRQQSIYLASSLIAADGTVFLHDADRKGEETFAAQYLGPAVERVAGPPELAVFGRGGE
jgi:glucuronoxylan 4-O-methyltransferase